MIENLVFEVVASSLSIQASDLSRSSSANQYSSWDSLMHLSIISQIEARLSIQIPLDIVFSARNLGDLINACQIEYDRRSE